MNLAELEAMSEDFINCATAAKFLGVKNENLHYAAIHRPETLGFPVCVIGNRVRFPRAGLVRFAKGEVLNGEAGR